MNHNAVGSPQTQLGQSFTVCSCGHRESGASPRMAEFNLAHHIANATDESCASGHGCKPSDHANRR